VLRQRLIHRVPKYGNDDERVDRYASQWGDRYAELVACTPRSAAASTSLASTPSRRMCRWARNVGATPDGRHAHTPLADGGLSPSAGRDRRGATAVLQSVSKLDLRLASNGTLLNMKFLPSFFAGDRAWTSSCCCCAASVGCTFRTCSSTWSRRRHPARGAGQPDAYRSLVVRVAGYSAYFTELDKDLQNEIISRTEFGDAN
jgi:pyruvate-formate lyase